MSEIVGSLCFKEVWLVLRTISFIELMNKFKMQGTTSSLVRMRIKAILDSKVIILEPKKTETGTNFLITRSLSLLRGGASTTMARFFKNYF